MLASRRAVRRGGHVSDLTAAGRPLRESLRFAAGVVPMMLFGPDAALRLAPKRWF